jgi:hypothetical protein
MLRSDPSHISMAQNIGAFETEVTVTGALVGSSKIAIQLPLDHRRWQSGWCWVIEDDDVTGLASSRIWNEHGTLLSMDDVYLMQHHLATTALATAVIHHSAFVVV